jgi:hypothetical protein
MDYILLISIAILILFLVHQNSKINELETCRNSHLSSMIDEFKLKNPEFDVIHPNRNKSHYYFNRYFQYVTDEGQKTIRLINTSDFNDFKDAVEHVENKKYEYKIKYFSRDEMPIISILTH